MGPNIVYHRKGQPIQNFGDFLTEYLASSLFLPVGMSAAAIYLIGSVIAANFINTHVTASFAPGRRIVFWGCGVRGEQRLDEATQSRIEVLSVRGPLSRSVLGLSEATAIGDPALLMPALYRTPAQHATQVRGMGALLVPHFTERRSDEELLRITGCDLVLRPNIANDVGAIPCFIDKLLAADFVLTGALHASIIAAAYGHSFGFWDSGNINVPFKWGDFAASVGIPCMFHTSVDLARRHYETHIHGSFRFPVLWPMLMAAPLAVRSDALMRIVAMDVERHGSRALEAEPSAHVVNRLHHALAGRSNSDD